MKKHFILTSLILFTGLLSAQNFIDKHYSGLEDLESSTVVHVSKMSFQIASTVIPEDEEDAQRIKDLISSVESFDLVQVPDMTDAAQTYNNAVRKLESQFEELINMKDKADHFSLHINENGGVVYELVGLGHDDDEFTVFSVVGEIALEDIGEILSKLDKGGDSPLDKVRGFDLSELSVYPNPVNSASEITIEVPDNMIGADATLVDMSGAVLKRFKINNSSQSVGVKSVQPGYFIVNIEKEGVTMKKKVLVVQ